MVMKNFNFFGTKMILLQDLFKHKTNIQKFDKVYILVDDQNCVNSATTLL